MTTAQQYTSTSAKLFDQARLELEAGDLIQASEKYWGAAAQALKAVAQTRGWPHNSHAHFYRIIRNLIDESSDTELFELFNAANQLHSNFYENWMQPREILQLADQVDELIRHLAEIHNANIEQTER